MEGSAKITKSERKEDVVRNWLVVDADNQTVGRIASQIATLLRGKHKPSFTSHVDCGDFVIVLNASKVVLEGKRPEQKYYYHNTQYPGGDRYETYIDMMKRHPERVIEHAVRGMLPKNRLGRQIIKKLKVYPNSEHPHEAQKPVGYELRYH